MHLVHEFKKVQLFLKNAKRVCIISHRSPDGDTIGSNVALRLALMQRGLQVTSVCADTIPERYYFLPHITDFQKKLTLVGQDVIFTLDMAAKHLLGFSSQQEDLFTFFPLINIDHHPDNTLFANLNIVDEHCASTTMILLSLFKSLDIPITKDMATALLLGIYSDTGSFMHANTSQDAFRAASELLSLGANISLIVKRLFKNFPISRLRLWGEVFKRMHINQHHVVSSVITKSDFAGSDTNSEDLSGVVEYLNMVPGSRFAMLLTEDAKNDQVKASLRTLNDDVDVSTIAHKFGGGGHKKASGFRIPGKIEEEVTWKVVNSKNEEVIKNIADI